VSRPVPLEAVALIRRYEDFEAKPYLDDVGVWTIGWGHAITDYQGNLIRGFEQEHRAKAEFPEPITRERGESLFLHDLASAGTQVLKLVTVPLTDGQFGALVSFVFNLGAGAFRRSTLLRHLNRGEYIAAAHQFSRWVYGGKPPQVLRGLVKRRESERGMFLGQTPEGIV
jgi:lysozyme